MELETARLRLVALDATALEACLFDPGRLEARMNLRLSRDAISAVVARAMEIKLMKMAGAPRVDFPWYTYWLLVVKAASFGAGLAGFKGAPGVYGSVELGYGIDPAWQGHGYMTEAVGALIGWAFQDRRCQRVTAETLVENYGSIRVLQKNGLACGGERGGMLFWTLERADWLAGQGAQ